METDFLRVAQVCARYFPSIGGVETHVMMISEWMKSHDVDIEILTTDPSGKLPTVSFVNGIKVRRFPSFAPGEAYYFSPKLNNFLRKHSGEYDIVHGHSYHSFPALYAALTKQNKFVFTPHYHGTGHTFVRRLLHIPYKTVGRISFKKADVVICVSNFEKKLVIENFDQAEGKTVVIPNGISDEFHALKKIRIPRKQILYVGRLEKYKRIDCIIHSLQSLPDDIELRIVGAGPDKNRLVKLVARLQLENKTVFSENLAPKDLLQSYSDARVFVSLSEYEAYGITVMEALASGTPCVVAKTSALLEFVDDKNCFGVDDPENPEEVANLILKAIGTEVTGFKPHSWEQIAQDTLTFYEKITNKSPSCRESALIS